MRTLLNDLRFAARYLANNPVFAAGGIAILATGISLAATLFAVVKGAILEPWPYRGADRLVTVKFADERQGRPGDGLWSALEVEDLRALDVFDAVIAGDARNSNLTYQGHPERVRAAVVTPNVFAMLGVQATFGRTASDGDASPGAAPVAIVSDAFWRTRLGADRAAIGRELRLEGVAYQIVGVMPPSFRFWDREIWMPLRLDPNDARSDRRWYVQGRLRPGVSLAEAQARLAVAARQLAQEHPDRVEYRTLAIAVKYLSAEVLRDLAPMLYLLVAAVGVVLFVAAANLANTLLTRGIAREGELAVRRAIGGSGIQLARQLLVESSMIGVAGGLTGAIGAAFLLPAVVSLVPYGYIPAESHIAIDWTVVAAAAACGLACSVLFGTIPAIRAARVDPAALLKRADTRTGSRRTHAWRDRLVIAQIALAVIVLAVAAVAFASLRATLTRYPGFSDAGVFTACVAVPSSAGPGARTATYERILRVVSDRAGVRDVAIASAMPVAPLAPARVSAEGATDDRPRDGVDVGMLLVSPGFQRVLKIPVIAGRAFSQTDTTATAPVAVVTESLASRLWPRDTAVGRRLSIGAAGATVVGVAGDLVTDVASAASRPLVLLPLAQRPPATAVIAAISDDPQGAGAAVTSAVGLVDPDVPVFEPEMLSDARVHALGPQLLGVVLLATFGVAVLALSAVGVYVVISQSVVERARELAIRRACGAADAALFRGELVRAARIVLAGTLVGVLMTAGVLRMLSSSFAAFRTGAMTAAPAGALAVGLLALASAAIPAWRSTRNLSPL